MSSSGQLRMMFSRAREAHELSMTWFANQRFLGQESSTSSSFGSCFHWKRKMSPWTGLCQHPA